MKRWLPFSVLIVLLIALAANAAVAQATGPLYDVKALWGDTHLPPGGKGQFAIQVRNVGNQTGDGNLTITDQLPVGVTAADIYGPFGNFGGSYECSGLDTETVQCVMPKFWVSEFVVPIPVDWTGLTAAPGTEAGGPAVAFAPPGYLPLLMVDVEVSPSASEAGTNTATVSGGGAAAPVSDVDQVSFDSTPAPFGIVPGSFEADVFDAYPFGSPLRQAGAHPFEQSVNFDFTESLRTGDDKPPTPYISPTEQVKTVEVTLPRGLIGNPEATPKCDPVDFSEEGSTFDSTACPANTQVGYLNVAITGGPTEYGEGSFFFQNAVAAHVPIYNLEPPKGTPVDLGFNAGLVQAHIFAALDPAQNYAIKTVTPNISSLVDVRGSEVTIWGVPGDPAHDRLRYYPEVQEGNIAAGAPFGSPTIRPFLTNPMDCGFDNGGHQIRIESYQRQGTFTQAQKSPEPLNVSGCENLRFRFDPEVSLQPTDRHAGAPTGLDVHLKVPQRDDEAKEAKELYFEEGPDEEVPVKAIATPPIKKAVVTFPEGMTLSPSAAQGLGSCSLAQIGISLEGVPNDDPVACPDNSQYGTLTLHTPNLPVDAQPEGFIYIAKQNENPFHNFLSLYLVIQEPERGILFKIPGRLDLDPQTGQIVSTFDDLPQFPVSDMQMTFKGGVRAGLVEPSTCGPKTISAEFFSWQDPATPHPVKSSYDVTEKPDGSPCVEDLGQRPFKPSLEAGTVSNAAGKYSPFVFRLRRTDDDQEFSQLGVAMPGGLTGKLAGISMCSDAGIAQAISRTGAGDGALEQGDPSCPASSLIGTTDVGAGVGVPLTFVPGNVYLAGPYRSAPLSIVVISPLLVGPYDLGVIAVRTALNVDRETAAVSAFSDPLPLIFQGIPVRIRDIRLQLDRQNFVLNPTSCARKTISAHVTGTGGDLASTADDTAVDLSNRFQAADCASLGFKPHFSFRLFGATHRGAHPKLRAFVKPRTGDANFAVASVALPSSEFLDQGHIRTVCTRVQFAANRCPAEAVYGHAVARTPLFDTSLEGPVYLRSSSHTLPDLVAVLKGPASQPVEVDLVGRVDSVRGGIRPNFEAIPDAPVSSFTLTMKGGKKGLLVNSTDLCAAVHRATVRLTAQNGRRRTLRPAMRSSCGKRGRKGRH